MSRHRRYPYDDMIYSTEHRYKFPELYARIGHRFDVADRDWTEFCDWCKSPICIYETVRDVGQNLLDKGISVTRNLCDKASLLGFLVAYSVNRPHLVQQKIDQLSRDLRELESRYPIEKFRVRKLWPKLENKLYTLNPEDWWEGVALMHRGHHEGCIQARQQFPVRLDRLASHAARNPLFAGQLFFPECLSQSEIEENASVDLAK